MTTNFPCPYCEGRRLVSAPRCPACGGFGRITNEGMDKGRQLRGWSHKWIKEKGESYFLPNDWVIEDDDPNECYF